MPRVIGYKSLKIAMLAIVFIFTSSNAYLFAQEKIKSLDELIMQEMGAPEQAAKKIERPKVQYGAEGMRDPFEGYKQEGEKGTSKIEGVKPLPELEVQGLVWGGPFPQAIINGEVLKIGDKIKDTEIIEISKKGVTVLYGGTQHELPAPGITEQEGQKKKEERGGKL